MVALTLVEQAEWLAGRGRSHEAEPLLAEAHDILEPLAARPWLDRIDAVAAAYEHADVSR
jgi:hypothetical protein